MKIEINNCYNMDCEVGMKLMQEQGLRADWVITDPPYGIQAGGVGRVNYVEQNGGIAERRNYTVKTWDNVRIKPELFDLMANCSKDQIIFGGNYYTDILPPTKSWVIWDKITKAKYRNNFADCEMAWCSKGQCRIFHYLFNGMIQDDMKNKDFRFHPTQKPTQLWVQLLNYYTKEGDLILDPFAGSQSLRIACHKLKRNYIGFEIDKEYYEKGQKWFESETSQLSLFDLM